MKYIVLTLFFFSFTNLPQNENLIGCWGIIEGGDLNRVFAVDERYKLQLYRNGSFVFNDFNDNLNKQVTLKGTYVFNGQILSLQYQDRPVQKFLYQYSKQNQSYIIRGYPLRSSIYRFFKIDCDSF